MRKIMFKLRNEQKKQTRRSDLKLEFPAGLEELTPEEARNIVAGESMAYWLGYAAGKIAQLFS
jgi:hypothetical protein